MHVGRVLGVFSSFLIKSDFFFRLFRSGMGWFQLYSEYPGVVWTEGGICPRFLFLWAGRTDEKSTGDVYVV